MNGAQIISNAQSILSRNISVKADHQKLNRVLEMISSQENFYFSYNSNIIKRDNIVTINLYNKKLKYVLDTLLGPNYEYRENNNYVIIRRAPIKVTLITNKVVIKDDAYIIDGYVLDGETGEAVDNASVYEKQLLIATLTNQQGYFKIKLRYKDKPVALTVSKDFYQDTTVTVDPKHQRQLSITIFPVEEERNMVTITPEDYFIADTAKPQPAMDTTHKYATTDSFKVEKTKVGMFLLSAKQKVQSLNLKEFFTKRPFQVGFVPGVGSHGKLGSQVINMVSFNVFGGYSGGVNGLELGGFFNIDKKDVKYLQAATIFNIVGGHMYGLQIAGVNNTVLGAAKGVQGSIVNNVVRRNFSGIQMAGFANYTGGKFRGLQLGLANYVKNLRGVQLGLINISDTSNGYSIGLINIVFKGYHKLSFYTDETVDANFAFKTGNAKLYSILMIGSNVNPKKKLYSLGYGIGHEANLSRLFSLNPELTFQFLSLNYWEKSRFLLKLHLNLNVKLGKYFSLFAGPSFAVSNALKLDPVSGYQISDNKRWIGWNAGINFF